MAALKFDEHFRRRLLLFLLASVVLGLIVELVFIFIRFNPLEFLVSLPPIMFLTEWVRGLLEAQSFAGVYLFFATAALFFFPSPLELFYFGFLKQGFSFPPLYLATLLGIISAQHVNYLLGRFFGGMLRKMIKEKTINKYQARIEKYGQYFILFMHAIPLPYAIMNFVVGLTKFKYRRWLLMMSAGLLFNFFLIYLISILF